MNLVNGGCVLRTNSEVPIAQHTACRVKACWRVGLCLAFAVVAALGPAGPAWGDGDLTYRAVIEGVSGAKLRATLKGLSATLARPQAPPASLLHLRRRAEHDTTRFLKALKAEGYYGASVAIEMDPDAEPISVVLRVAVGPVYRLDAVTVVSTDEAIAPPRLPTAADLGIELGQPAAARAVINAEKKLIELLQDEGFPFPKVTEREAVVDHAAQTLAVTYHTAVGSKAFFGPAQVTGLESVQERVVLSQLPWREGDVFQGRLLRKAQKQLYETGLFALVRIDPAEEAAPDGRAPIQIQVTERKHRTVGAGIHYRTDEGIGTRFLWEHRNVRGLGRRLRLEADLSQTVYDAAVSYRLDRFRRDDQSLLLTLGAGEISPDAYTSRQVGGAAWVSRKLRDTLTLGAGLALKLDEVEQFDQTDTYQLLSLPIQLEWDRTDDALNPNQGLRLKTRLEPFVDVFGGETSFIKGEIAHSQYYRLGDAGVWGLALRLRLGAIAGEDLEGVPADERFYAGGSTSIRGYPYQSVGPLVDDDPLGGRSVAETSIELRRRLTKTIGLVAFVDAGSAFASAWPDFSDSLRWSAGIGARYFTPIGPIRVDVAVPLNRRDDVDDSFQFYISIGQAF